MRKIKVSLKERSYDIVIADCNYANLGRFIKNLDIGRDAFIITNKKVLSVAGSAVRRSLEKEGFVVHFEIVPDSEKTKSFPVLSALNKKVARYDKNKSLFFIALGGGVIGDLAGFIASVYKRGLPYIQLPTTLLAQVDSAIGGKTAIDLPCGKNLIGSFYQPRLVFSEVSMLKALPLRQVRNGLAEVVKYGVIKDRKLFRYLENKYSGEKSDKTHLSLDWEYIVESCSRIKAKIVEQDERDNRGIRIILNFGHTIGHGIEAATGFEKKYSHGEAVALGMLAASYIGEQLGVTSTDTADRIKCLLRNIGLPSKISGVKINKIKEAVNYDKKFKGTVNRVVMPIVIGKATVGKNIPERLILEAIKKISS